MTTKSQKRLMRRVLFMEIGGFLSLAISMAVVAMLLSIKLLDLKALLLPGAGMILVFIFILLTIRYTRKDLHRIHELHSKPIYSLGRNVIYLLGAGMMGYAIYLYFSTEDFWTDVGVVILANLLIVVGVFAIFYTSVLGYLVKNEHLRHESVSFSDLFLVVILPVALISVSVYRLFSTQAETAVHGKADFEIAAKAVIGEFEVNEAKANAKYHGKILQFSGAVVEVSGDSAMLVKLDVGVEGTTANCGFDKTQMDEVKKIGQGDKVEVKCSCSGFTKPDDEESMLSEKSLDLVRCSLVPKGGGE